MSLNNKLFIFISSFLLFGCYFSRLDRKAQRFFKKNTRKETVLLYSSYFGALNSFYEFSLTTNNKFGYSGANIFKQFHSGTWKQRGNSDTIDLHFYKNHSIWGLEKYVVIKNLTDSNLIKQSFVEFSPADTLHGGSKFPIKKIDPQLFDLLK